MTEIIKITDNNGRLTCNVPISQKQWAEILTDNTIVTPGRMRALLAFYYMPDHKATCKQCAETFGQNTNTYNSAITSLGETIVKKIATFRIEDADGKEKFWPVVMGEGKSVKGTDGVFQWTLRSELVEAIREYIIRDALARYTADFVGKWSREEYKWRALKTFQDNWDIDAPDFADMLSKAFAQHKNLLDTTHSFPKSALIEVAQSKPELVRGMFRNLFDEEQSLEERIGYFIYTADNEFVLGKGKSHYQSTNTISAYLWFRFPGKYYIYKWGEYNSVARKIGFTNSPRATGSPAEVIKGYAMYHQLQDAIASDYKLLDDHAQILSKQPDKYFYPDGLATLTYDFGFWISRYYTPLIESVLPPNQSTIDDDIPPLTESELDSTCNDVNYWWLVASPKYWSFSDLSVGREVSYTVKNENGNKRRVPANFEQAKAGDIVIGYEAYPMKKIVALAKVAKPSNGEIISFVKTEELSAPVSWFDFKNLISLSEMEFIRNPNGSFFKLTRSEYEVLLDLIRQENPEPENNPLHNISQSAPYSKAQFLEEVFMSPDAYDNLTTLLRLKKNVILNGAPGVGKTFSAKRVAYAMMGETDESRIEMVQFHQNFSYEDFIMGYKPTDNGGFELRNGLFYNFCKKAEANPGKDYFFIIDEINRGNLSKIFGELLMLIEKNYRGTQIKLAYKNELFSVPENLYIIGMMNTADRSLAMIDYALRRRFSFFPMKPGFDTEGFMKEMTAHSDTRIKKVVEAVIELNARIADDDSLGEGFCIGHSYFCGKPTDENWIEQVVNYDLCPMLDEYWFDSKEKCRDAKNKLRDLLK